MLRRFALFFGLNILIVLTVTTILQLLHVGPYITKYGIDLQSLAIFSLIWGMAGAIISLSISRYIAKKMMGVQVINPMHPKNAEEEKIYDMVSRLAQKARLPDVPEVGIFQSSEPNAFATGPSKRRSLVAVSTGLLQHLSDEEVEAVIGHEISHISNGDMVTMTLLQGVVNAFVIFFSRALAYVVTNALGRSRDGKQQMSYFTYMMFTFLFEIVFMVFGSMLVAFVSRKREYRADAGSADLLGTKPMISALESLNRFKVEKLNSKTKPITALMINSPRHSGSFIKLFATHPPIEERILHLNNHALASFSHYQST